MIGIIISDNPIDNAFKLSLFTKKVIKPPSKVDIPENNVSNNGNMYDFIRL